VTVDSDPAPLGQDLAHWLEGQRFGELHVLRATSTVITDVDGYTAIDLAAVVEDPTGDTWRPEDVVALRRALRTEAQRRLRAPIVYVQLRPETEDAAGDDAGAMP
jgi:hypothetical protein